jgi:hypothetical protein
VLQYSLIGSYRCFAETCSILSSALSPEVAGFSKTLVFVHKTTWFCLSEDSTLLRVFQNTIQRRMFGLNTACFVIRTIQAITSTETLRMVYFAYVHSIMRYGIIFWGNQPHSDKIFKIQKRLIRIITNSRTRDSCRELFKSLEILPLYSQYIFSLSIFVIKNKHLFSTNNQIHSAATHTRFKTNLHPPIANLTKFQKGVYYSGIKILNNLPHDIKDLAN